MATHPSILAWRSPWREEPGRLQPMGSQRDSTEAAELTYTQRVPDYSRKSEAGGTGWRWVVEPMMPTAPLCLSLSRISSVSKIFPVLMLYRLWEEGIVASLDDPLERYASAFTINNPLGMASASQQRSLVDGLEEVGPASRPSPVTLRRMASQLSGEWL